MNDDFNNQNNINEVNNNNINNEDVINKLEDSTSVSNQNEVENTNVSQNNNLEQSNENIYNKKNNKSSIPVIIMFIVLILFVFVFLGNKNNLFSNNNKQEQNNGLIDNNDSNKDNLQEEDMNDKDNQTNDKVDEENIILEKDYAKLEQKVLDEYYLKNTDIINAHIEKYKYSALSNDENVESYLKVSYDEFYKAYTVHNIVNMLEPVNGVGDCKNSVNHKNDEYDKNGVKYPKYCAKDKYSTYGCIEEYAKAFGLTVDEISRMDKSVWSLPCCGGFCDELYDIKYIKEKYPDIYNSIFESSFSISLDNRIYGVIRAYSYDKNIDKIISIGTGGTASFYENVILESKQEDNLYKVVFVEGTFSPSEGGKWQEDNIKEEISKYDKNEAKELIKINKDKLPNYEITFEKTNTGYRYMSIKKIENNSASTKINYEIKINSTNKELYVNNNKVNGIQVDNELGNLEVKEFKDLLIVDEQNPGPSRKLFVVDKNGTATEIDYKVSTYNQEFINYIDSYKVDGNNLYIKVNRQWGNGYLDWYCRYDDKNEVAEYEVKYEYVNGNLDNRQVINEITITDKYKNEKCN